MSKKRIEVTTSRTAEWTCICRAISSLEKSPFYKSDDRVALSLLPYFLMLLIRIPSAGRLFLSAYGFKLNDHRCAQDLQAMYFQGADGRAVGRINGTHCIASASRP